VGDQRWMAFGQESGKSSMLFFLLSPQLQFWERMPYKTKQEYYVYVAIRSSRMTKPTECC
jgi:hypothetical protein